MRTPYELLEGEILLEGRIVDASNATLFGSISNADSSFPIVYKPIAGERPLWDFPDGNLASREVASYLVSVAGGFNCVPTTVLREGPFGLGAVQEWIEVNSEIDPISLGQSQAVGIRNIALFDVIVNNTDRKFGHILPLNQDEIFGCDHGVTFHEDFKLRTVIWQFAGEELSKSEHAQLDAVETWIKNDGLTKLHELLTEAEVNSTLERIDTLRKSGFPMPSEEWPAVPWPPV
jgi:uncharacterized repeat protein (TIGR03843 family)